MLASIGTQKFSFFNMWPSLNKYVLLLFFLVSLICFNLCRALQLHWLFPAWMSLQVISLFWDFFPSLPLTIAHFQASSFLCPGGNSLLSRTHLLSVFPPLGWNLPLWMILSYLHRCHLLHCPLPVWSLPDFLLFQGLWSRLCWFWIFTSSLICKITFEIVPVPLLHIGMRLCLYVVDIVWRFIS